MQGLINNIEFSIRVFHKVAKILNNGNNRIRDFTTWKLKKIPASKCYSSEDWTWDINHFYLMLYSLSYWAWKFWDLYVAMLYWF